MTGKNLASNIAYVDVMYLRSTPRRALQRLLAVSLIGAAVFLTITAQNASPFPLESPLLRTGLATIMTPKGFIIFAEIADTPEKRSKGLMFRRSLAPDRGMLFTFSDLDYWTFWMKNTKIPLDIIWMDQNGKVVYTEHQVPICLRKDEGCPRYHPHKKALHVLELRAGMAKELDLQPGTQLTIEMP